MPNLRLPISSVYEASNLEEPKDPDNDDEEDDDVENEDDGGIRLFDMKPKSERHEDYILNLGRKFSSYDAK